MQLIHLLHGGGVDVHLIFNDDLDFIDLLSVESFLNLGKVLQFIVLLDHLSSASLSVVLICTDTLIERDCPRFQHPNTFSGAAALICQRLVILFGFCPEGEALSFDLRENLLLPRGFLESNNELMEALVVFLEV